jgi:hypothetical protein
MNRYRELIGAMEPSEDFKPRLSENVMAYTPMTRRTYHPRTALQSMLLVILITLALAVTAGAAYVALNWDPIFVRRFHPTEEQTSQLGNAVGSGAIVSDCGGVTLKVRQTLGDDKTIYVILDIALPESAPLEELIGSDPDAAHPDILPDKLWFSPVPLTYEDVKGKSFGNDFKPVHDLLLPFDGSWTVKAEAADIGTNTLTYLLCCSPESASLDGKPLTILIDRLVRSGNHNTILEGPFVISWTPEFSADSRTFEIRDGDYTVGIVTISPFTLKGSLYKSDYASADELFHSVSLTFRDGKTYMPQHEGYGGSYSSPSGACSFDTQFTNILTLDDVAAVHMAGYTIELDQ